MPRRATAQDVADLAGVSRSAVSLVLNGRADGNISAVKQEAVRDAAAQLHYTPNAVALSLRSKRTATIGVLTWRDRWHVPPVAPRRALHGGQQRRLPADDGRRGAAPRLQVDALLDRRVDGFVIVAPELADVPGAGARRGRADGDGQLLRPDPRGLLADPRRGGGRVERGPAPGRGRATVGLGVLVGRGRAWPRNAGCAGCCQVAGPRGPARTRGGRRPGTTWRTDTGRRVCSSRRPAPERARLHARAAGARRAPRRRDLGLSVPGDLSLVSLDDGEDIAA